MNAQPIGFDKYSGDGLTREQREFDAAYDARDKAIHSDRALYASYRERFCESSEPVSVRLHDGRYVSVIPEEVFAEWLQNVIAKECRR